jgi:hypothetical protein
MEKLQTEGQNKPQGNIYKFMHCKFNLNHVRTRQCSRAKELLLLPLKLHKLSTTIIMAAVFYTDMTDV